MLHLRRCSTARGLRAAGGPRGSWTAGGLGRFEIVVLTDHTRGAPTGVAADPVTDRVGEGAAGAAAEAGERLTDPA